LCCRELCQQQKRSESSEGEQVKKTELWSVRVMRSGVITSLLIVLFSFLSFSQTGPPFLEYISPLPGSALVSQHCNIIVRSRETIDAFLAVQPHSIIVSGSKSGDHAGMLTLSDDQRSLVFEPTSAFMPEEFVTVRLNSGVFSRNSGHIPPIEFQFRTSPLSSLEQESFLNRWMGIDHQPPPPTQKTVAPYTVILSKTQADTIPADFPARTILASGVTAPGLLFLASFKIAEASDHLFFVSFVPSDKQYLMTLDNTGKPLFYRSMRSMSTDFKLQPNGYLTYYDNVDNAFCELDSTYEVIDQFRAGNGYKTDLHDLVVMPNGHSLMMAYDPEIIDMSQIVPGGNPYATVIGAVIQELDQNKKVIFQWRSFDHFKVTDAVWEDMKASTIDAVHPNTIELDTDGNLLLSSRHMDEITKIDRRTGDVLWRWGGKNNQFTFVNDTMKFSHQHTIRRTPTGTLILFDNGNFRSNVGSRAVEYSVDEHAKTATLVWQFRHSPDIKAIAMGSVQRLSNGNTLIGWGTGSPAATEVRPDKSVAFELQLPDSIVSYRAFRNPWKQLPSTTSVQLVNEVPHVISLAQNYPNPFNPATKIQVSLPRATTVKLEVFDVLGRPVATLANGPKPAGTFSVQFDGSGRTSGIYLYRLTTTENSLVRIMTLIK
jgi:hypothetical protein